MPIKKGRIFVINKKEEIVRPIMKHLYLSNWKTKSIRRRRWCGYNFHRESYPKYTTDMEISTHFWRLSGSSLKFSSLDYCCSTKKKNCKSFRFKSRTEYINIRKSRRKAENKEDRSEKKMTAGDGKMASLHKVTTAKISSISTVK